MQLYRVINTTTEDATAYHGTRDLAHEDAKGHMPIVDNIRIELVEVPTDKDGLVCLLNDAIEHGGASKMGFEVLRTWMLTPRGGLKEVGNGE